MNPSNTSPKENGREKPAPLRSVADKTVRDASRLVRTSGALTFGQGLIATIIALSLAFLSLLAVLAFHFPQYLTTPALRHAYSVDTMRKLLFGALIISGGLALASIVLDNRRRLNGLALVLVQAAVMLGGSRVPVGNFPDHTPYIGLDWFILDLLGSTMIFVLLEKAFPLYKNQPVFRAEWQTDMNHFAVNHFIVGLALLVVNFLNHRVFGWMVNAGFQQAIQHIVFIPQLLLCMLVADLMEYITHRAYHEVPLPRILSMTSPFKTRAFRAA